MRRADEWLSATLRAQLRARRTIGIGAALVVVALTLTQVPLFNVLGFEFAFAMAIAGSIAGADLGAAYLRRWRDEPRAPLDVTAPPIAVLLRIVGGAIALTWLLLVPPLLIIVLDALWVRTCDWGFGALCYAMMPGVSAALAATLGVLCALLVPAHRRVLGNALPYLVLLGSLAAALWRFYGAPAVFSYSPLAGYFPGNLYDERIELAAPFYWARTFHVAVALAALGVAAFFLDLRDLRLRPVPRPRGLRRGPLALTLLGAALASMLWGQSGQLGFAVSAEDMAEALPRRFETEHFVIHYPPGGAIERDIRIIAEDHEFRRAQVVRTLGAAPARKIHSFYFDSADQKHRLMGARNVYMAKPWRSEIYINHAGFPHQVLRHEIAHVVAGAFGDPIFHVSARRLFGVPAFFNVGLIEGIAVAADWPDHFTRALTPHQSVKAMLELGFVPPIERLLSTGFFEFSSARSYTASGSFVRFLLDRHGIERLQRFYESGGDFSAAYDESARDLFAAWRRMIEATQLPDGAAEVVRERFRRGGIFDRPCPHAIARARSDARRLESEGKTGEAIELVRQVCRDAPGEPAYELDLADLLARGGFTGEATRRYLALADDAEHQSSTVRVGALVRAAGLAVRAGDDPRALALLERAATLPVDDDLARQVVALRRVLAESGPARVPLRAYFWGDPLGTPSDPSLGLARAAEAALLDPSDGLAHYLVGRQLRGRGDPAATTRALLRALDSGDLGVLVTREAARLLAEAAYLAGDYPAVERAATLLTAPDQPLVTRLYGHDWRERLAWKRTGTVPDPALGPAPTPPATP